ncbi:MAG: adenylate kinase [Chlamydiia bacterium]|nr:adenylate kinase [Chlamydiia bacterium]MCH9624459.1 adenylate kinase [Chlamydiia bacterium]
MKFLRLLFFTFFSLTLFSSPIIVLYGKPGAGKGTVGAYLSDKLHLKRISSGEFLLAEIDRGTPLGREVKEKLEGGEIIPDDMICSVFFSYFEKEGYLNGCILDGFPRTVNQAKLLDQRACDCDITVIHLEVTDQEVLNRIAGRWMCKDCKYPYHEKNNPPVVALTCDHCRGELYRRHDDCQSSIKRRLEVYKEVTEPILLYYGQQRVNHIDGQKEIKEVCNEVLQTLQ